jgi:GNAT superfamily N-acetyltransferase
LAAPAVIGRGGLELAVDVVESLPPEALLSERLATPGGQVGERGLVVTGRRQGGVVGLLRGRSRGPVALVDELVVEPAHRRTGVAHHLLAAFESEARARGCRWLEALVPAGQPASRALFDRRGWVSEAGHPTGELIRAVREVPGGAPTSTGPAGAGQ